MIGIQLGVKSSLQGIQFYKQCIINVEGKWHRFICDFTQFTKTLPSYTHNIEVCLTKLIAELFKRQTLGISLVGQWTGIRLPTLDTGVQSLVGEDPTPPEQPSHCLTAEAPPRRGPAPPRPRPVDFQWAGPALPSGSARAAFWCKGLGTLEGKSSAVATMGLSCLSLLLWKRLLND